MSLSAFSKLILISRHESSFLQQNFIIDKVFLFSLGRFYDRAIETFQFDGVLCSLFLRFAYFFSPSLTTHPNVRYQLLMFHEPSTIKWRTYGKLRLCCRSCLRHFSIYHRVQLLSFAMFAFESSFNVLKCIEVCSSFQFFFFVFFFNCRVYKVNSIWNVILATRSCYLDRFLVGFLLWWRTKWLEFNSTVNRCPLSNMRHLNWPPLFQACVVWNLKDEKKTLLNYEMHFVHSTLSHTIVRIHKIYKQPRFIFKTALFGKKHLRRAFMTVNSSSSSCCCENGVVDNHLTHACGC